MLNACYQSLRRSNSKHCPLLKLPLNLSFLNQSISFCLSVIGMWSGHPIHLCLILSQKMHFVFMCYAFHICILSISHFSCPQSQPFLWACLYVSRSSLSFLIILVLFSLYSSSFLVCVSLCPLPVNLHLPSG